MLAVRDIAKGQAVAEELRAEQPEGTHTVAELDTSDLSSVAAFADGFANRRVDILVLNAGINGTKGRQQSVDGHELIMATNYFGHFALTARLLESLRRASRARVVTLGSLVATFNALSFRLAAPPFSLTPATMSLLFLTYAVGSFASTWASM